MNFNIVNFTMKYPLKVMQLLLKIEEMEAFKLY